MTILAVVMALWCAVCFVLALRAAVGWAYSRWLGPRWFPRLYGWSGESIVNYYGEWPAPLWCLLDGAHEWEAHTMQDEGDFSVWRECARCGRTEEPRWSNDPTISPPNSAVPITEPEVSKK